MKNKPFHIDGHAIQPGETARVEVNIARLPSHSNIDITIVVGRAEKPGPVLLLTGGLHGDEVNGIETVRRIIDREHHLPSRGTVICIPIINIFGFINFSREVPDGKDINRAFPGNKNGSLASRVAHFMMREIIPKIDYGIDFHTGGASRTNYPQVRCLLNDDANTELAQAFHAPFTLHAKHRPSSLRKTAFQAGKRILVYEGGESMRFDELAIEEGINGTLRLMKHLEMKNTAPTPSYENKQIRHSTWIRARNSGLFRSKVKCGQYVAKNQLVGILTDTFGEFKINIKTRTAGYIIGLNNNPVVLQGDALLHIGVHGGG
ncbi:MAG: succinylglutamate desuccinylase/aspartoacylase family protein [Cyclobacteriaceae bacterium]|nr:succinylglutamate desuccinylase/aspartoacylase family protein [Cyclobacteriaceae bacterium]